LAAPVVQDEAVVSPGVDPAVFPLDLERASLVCDGVVPPEEAEPPEKFLATWDRSELLVVRNIVCRRVGDEGDAEWIACSGENLLRKERKQPWGNHMTIHDGVLALTAYEETRGWEPPEPGISYHRGWLFGLDFYHLYALAQMEASWESVGKEDVGGKPLAVYADEPSRVRLWVDQANRRIIAAERAYRDGTGSQRWEFHDFARLDCGMEFPRRIVTIQTEKQPGAGVFRSE